MAQYIAPDRIARALKDRRAIGNPAENTGPRGDGYTIKGQAIRFTLLCVLSVFWLVLAYLWAANLQPSLPLVPAACGFIGLLTAGHAGAVWAWFDA